LLLVSAQPLADNASMLRATGLIGNCQYAAHANAWGEIVWLCMPRFDSEPIFGKLIDAESGGHFRIAPPAGGEGAQRYETNTNILVTTFADASGSFRVIDFAPRFEHNGRSFRPTQLVRIVEPISGTPQVRVDIAPVLGFSKKAPQVEQGSHHLRFLGYDAELRLTTDMPLSYLNQREMTLTKPLYFMLSYGPPLEGQLDEVCGRFLRQTTDYWQKWVKHCNVPPLHQDAVIRSALALKLHCFEDTGAIVASTTTSLPESAGAGRNWDYRYCWLRDAYYALKAFRSLGHFEEREQFLQFLLNVVGSAPDLQLQPLYRIDGSPNLEESILTEWGRIRR
jgi:GH15 family glucan-1,4-alpha-glucosidase